MEAFGPQAIRRHAERDADPLPAPPDREHYGGDNHLSYWLSGLADCLWLEQLADRHGVALDNGVLDFGCSSGRVLRHFAARGSAAACYGADLQPQAVRWARRHLTGATIALSTVIPSLPLADGSVDLVYAGSVFTHIDDFEEATLLELRRVLKPGGIAVLTFHPGRIWADMAADPQHPVRKVVQRARHRLDPQGIEPIGDDVFATPLAGERVVFTGVTYPVNNTNVIHTHAWVRAHWGRVFDVLEIVETAHSGHQDAAVLRPR
jgi:ubiquinone/menaquinone biosynthesis C-methylase UbiE